MPRRLVAPADILRGNVPGLREELIVIVTDADCVAFLQWALPHLGRRWAGYRKVRRRVCKSIWRRVDELGLASLADYRQHLGSAPQEWQRLDALIDVTISRFYRDRAVFDYIASDVLPALVERARAAGLDEIQAWSAGCASGEEPYTLAMIWRMLIASGASGIRLRILGTDIKSTVLQRAGRAQYPGSALRDLPTEWRDTAFRKKDGQYALDDLFRSDVEFTQHDIRDTPPRGPFDLILCRYQAFTYFDDNGQRAVLRTFEKATHPGAVLVLGNREEPPLNGSGFDVLEPRLGVLQRGLDFGHPPSS